jgi:hypothetical protein
MEAAHIGTLLAFKPQTREKVANASSYIGDRQRATTSSRFLIVRVLAVMIHNQQGLHLTARVPSVFSRNSRRVHRDFMSQQDPSDAAPLPVPHDDDAASADQRPPTPPPVQKSRDPALRHRLSSFFRYYEPTQLAVLDTWLTNWAGREKQLFGELVRFHGPEPDVHQRLGAPARALSAGAKLEASCRNLVQQTLLLYAPERIGDVQKILSDWDGQYEVLQERLQRQIAYREHVFRVFREHMPDRVPEVPALLRMWLGREMELLKVLARSASEVPGRPPARKRGSANESSLALSAMAGEGAGGRTPLPFASYREQLLHFYRLYNPERVGDIDAILEQYRGREPALFRKLYKKYCKEPGPDTMGGAPTIGRDAAAAADESAMAAQEIDHASVRHLMAATSLERTAELDEFVRSFKGTDAELAWALRSYCRGATASPSVSKSKRGVVNEQLLALEKRSAMLHVELETEYAGKSAGPSLGMIPENTASGPAVASQLTPEDLAASLRGYKAPSRAERLHSMQVLLGRVGLSQLAGKFVDQDLTPELLPTLTGVDLRDLGIEPESERRSTIQRLRQLFK